jgi:hypothetical protein
MRIDGRITIEAESKEEAIEWIEEHGQYGKSELYMPVKEVEK